MKIELRKVSIRELVNNYVDLQEDGVFGYGGLLDIRPPYQREFIYKDRQRDAVIETIMKGYPLNVMYWASVPNEKFEVIDGQQRTISICQYVEGDFAFNSKYFHNLQNDERELILNYELMVYVCSGSDSEKLEWFRTINIAGEKLTDQELRNAVYSGSWLSDAKRYFSKSGCAAFSIANDLMSGTAIRQEYLETAISWISSGMIEDYMGRMQREPNANELWLYFQSVINWVNVTFPNYRREMKGIPWGELYNRNKSRALDPKILEHEVATLMADEDVTNKKGIYHFVLDGREHLLNIRAFSPNQKREAYERQDGICVVCGKPFPIEEMEADHVTPWISGGKTDSVNCQMLCREDNRRKSNI
jgi:hypothetical protein